MIQKIRNESERAEDEEETPSKRQQVERETADFFGDLFTRTQRAPVVNELTTYLTSRG